MFQFFHDMLYDKDTFVLFTFFILPALGIVGLLMYEPFKKTR